MVDPHVFCNYNNVSYTERRQYHYGKTDINKKLIPLLDIIKQLF